MIFKRLGAILFALAFICAIGIFTNFFSGFMPKNVAKWGVIILGGAAMLMNLLSYRFDQDTESNNPVFWIGSVMVFIGLIFKIQHWPYSQYLLIAGLFVTGMSYFFNPFKKQDDESNDDLLDS